MKLTIKIISVFIFSVSVFTTASAQSLSRYDSAKYYFNHHEYTKSAAIITEIIPASVTQATDTATYIEMNYALAMSLYNTQRHEQAVPYFNTVITLVHASPKLADGKYLNSLIQLGTIYYTQKQYQQALHHFVKSAKLLSKAKGEHSKEHTYLLNNLGNTYFKMKDYQRADSVYQKVLASKKTTLGEKNPEYAASLVNVGLLYKATANYGSAENYLSQAVTVYKDTLGVNSLEYISTLNHLGHTYLLEKKYKEAEKIFRENETILATQTSIQFQNEYLTCLSSLVQLLTGTAHYTEAENYQKKIIEIRKSQSPGSAEHVEALTQLGLLYKNMNRYLEAEAVLSEAYVLAKEKFGNRSGVYAQVLSASARLYSLSGQYARAEETYTECEHLYKELYGESHVEYAALLNNIAVLYEETGRYEQAEKYYNRSLETTGSTLGKKHPEYAITLNNIGQLYQSMGRYEQAEPVYNEALRIQKETLGTTHPDYAVTLNNLALLYHIVGRNEEAEKLYTEAANTSKATYGEQNLDYALALNNLASLYEDNGKFTQAADLYSKSLTILKTIVGTSHPNYATTLNNLALLKVKLNQFTEAEVLYKQDIDIVKNTLGTRHPNYATSISNLAALYEDMERYDEAEKYYLEALSIRKETLGEKHPDIAKTYSALGRLYTAKNNMTEAEKYWILAMDHYLSQIKIFFPYMSEKEKSQFYSSIRLKMEQFNSFAMLRANANPAIIAKVYNYQLATKAILLNSSDKLRKNIMSSGDQQLITLFKEWQNEKELLAKIYNQPQKELEKQHLKPDSIENRINKLEKDLVLKSNLFKTNNSSLPYVWTEIQKKLKPGELACEVIRFPRHKFDKGGGTFSDSVYYTFLFVDAASTNPKWTIIKGGYDLEKKYVSYYKNTTLFKKSDTYSYNKFWQPITSYLTGSKKLYISPDGVYNQINLNTLYNPAAQKFLIDEIELVLITSGRDIIDAQPYTPENNNIVLVGDPVFGTSNDFRANLAPLPGTHKEINTIKEITAAANWKPFVLLQDKATEEEIKHIIKSPRVLHIATHGFFEQDLVIQEEIETEEPKNVENPLLKSGLMLAYSSRNKKNISGTTEDGILTAYEAMNLILDKTEIVILSACETGLGEVKNGEGVYGLQRALKIAGARCIIISLWKVNDETTQQLMSNFYTEWLKTNDKRVAFRNAQIKLRTTYPDPYYWGAFVMIGE